MSCRHIIVLAIALSVTGCGSDASSPAPPATAPAPPATAETSEPPGRVFAVPETSLRPLGSALAGSRPLWPKEDDHKPLGFNAVSAGSGGTTLAEEALLHETSGATMARIPASWGLVAAYPDDPSRPQWDYGRQLDPAYAAYVSRGIRPLLNIVRTPRRFTKYAGTRQKVGACDGAVCWAPPLPQYLPDLARFAADLARRYPLAAGIEVWNEPNLGNPFWGSDVPDPEHYTAMLEAVHAAVKQVNPDLPVLGGSLAPVRRDHDVVMSTRTFLRRMLAAGAAKAMDGLAFHAYYGEPGPALAAPLVFVHEEIAAAYADADVPMRTRLAVTEFGASTTQGWSPQRQATALAFAFHLWNQGSSRLPLARRVDAAFAHRAVDDPAPAYGNTWQSGFGWYRVKDASGRFAPKPVVCQFRRLFAGKQDCPKQVGPVS